LHRVFQEIALVLFPRFHNSRECTRFYPEKPLLITNK
jgi:hypothetical protein